MRRDPQVSPMQCLEDEDDDEDDGVSLPPPPHPHCVGGESKSVGAGLPPENPKVRRLERSLSKMPFGAPGTW